MLEQVAGFALPGRDGTVQLQPGESPEEEPNTVQNQCRRCCQLGHTEKEAKEEAANQETTNQPGLIKKYLTSKYSWPGNVLLQEVSAPALAQKVETTIE